MTIRIHPNDPIVWCTPSSLQLGDGHMVTMLTDVDTSIERLLEALVHGIREEEFDTTVKACGISTESASLLLERIQAHLVYDTPDQRFVTLPDHTSRSRSALRAERLRAQRHAARICIDGMSDVGVLVAWMLAERGVGSFAIIGDEKVGKRSIVDRMLHSVRFPGADRAEALCDLLTSSFAVEATTTVEDSINFSVITAAHALHPERHQYWLRRDIRHLAVIAGVHYAILSQTVEPGRGACLECLDVALSHGDDAHAVVRSQLLDCSLPVWDSLRSHTLAAAVTERVLEAIDRPVRMPNNLVHRLDGLHWTPFTVPTNPQCGCLNPTTSDATHGAIAVVQ